MTYTIAIKKIKTDLGLAPSVTLYLFGVRYDWVDQHDYLLVLQNNCNSHITS